MSTSRLNEAPSWDYEDLPPLPLPMTKDTGNSLMDEHGRLIESVVRNIYRSVKFPHLDDLYIDLQQVARLAFLEAVQLYTPSREAKFTTFAWHFMHNALLRYLKSELRYFGRLNVMHSDPAISDKEMEEEAYDLHTIGSPDDQFLQVEQAQLQAQVRNFLPKLSERQQEVVKRICWDGMTKSDVARLYGVSPSMINKIMSQVALHGKRYIHQNPFL